MCLILKKEVTELNFDKNSGHFNEIIKENDEDENSTEQHFEKNVEHISHKFQKNLEHISHDFEKNLEHIYENIKEDDVDLEHNSNKSKEKHIEHTLDENIEDEDFLVVDEHK